MQLSFDDVSRKARVQSDSFITLQKITPPCHCLSISIFDPYSFAIPHLQADYFDLIHLYSWHYLDYAYCHRMLVQSCFFYFTISKSKQGTEHQPRKQLSTCLDFCFFCFRFHKRMACFPSHTCAKQPEQHILS